MSYQNGTSSPGLRCEKFSSVIRYAEFGRISNQATLPEKIIAHKNTGLPTTDTSTRPVITIASATEGAIDSTMFHTIGRYNRMGETGAPSTTRAQGYKFSRKTPDAPASPALSDAQS